MRLTPSSVSRTRSTAEPLSGRTLSTLSELASRGERADRNASFSARRVSLSEEWVSTRLARSALYQYLIRSKEERGTFTNSCGLVPMYARGVVGGCGCSWLGACACCNCGGCCSDAADAIVCRLVLAAASALERPSREKRLPAEDPPCPERLEPPRGGAAIPTVRSRCSVMCEKRVCEASPHRLTALAHMLASPPRLDGYGGLYALRCAGATEGHEDSK